uniref:Uncharacterized protein n=1 Tax=Ditylenchus dipsaci TaxID=166011 RepID=A0A915EUT1_9BILA
MGIFLHTVIFLQVFTLIINAYYLPEIQFGVGEGDPGKCIRCSWGKEEFFTVPIDHFAYTDARTFKLRYFINVTHFVPNGPIFFYTGGEATIMRYLDRMGFVWDIAKEFGAAIVFAEHRFFGKSHAEGSNISVKTLGYLTAEQGLADYAMLITHLKQVVEPTSCQKIPVIAFGGSYAGFMTAWMRVKYPHIIDGGVASSAPIHSFINAEGYESSSLNRLTGRALERSGCNLEKIHASYEAIYKLSRTDKGRAFLNKALRLNQTESLLQTSKDGDELLLMLQYGMQDMTMFNFPYPVKFPAWPLKEFCKSFVLRDNQSLEENATAIVSQLQVYYNASGEDQSFCLDFLVLHRNGSKCMQQRSPFDPFLKDCPYSIEKRINDCEKKLGHLGYDRKFYRPNWVVVNYGLTYPTATNIVFSNGDLDPWSGGGWSTKNVTKGSLVSLIVKDGAHNYGDLHHNMDNRFAPFIKNAFINVLNHRETNFILTVFAVLFTTYLALIGILDRNLFHPLRLDNIQQPNGSYFKPLTIPRSWSWAKSNIQWQGWIHWIF